jgi:hypothetical protein
MSEQEKYSIKKFPSSRQLTIDLGYIGLRKHHIKALIELDGTRAMELFISLPQFLRISIMKGILKNPFEVKKMMGTVVVTSIGMMGIVKGWIIPVSFHPICFALGSIVKKPGVFENEIQIREFLQMTILIDHDVIDGAPATRFVARLTDLIESGFGL